MTTVSYSLKTKVGILILVVLVFMLITTYMEFSWSWHHSYLSRKTEIVDVKLHTTSNTRRTEVERTIYHNASTLHPVSEEKFKVAIGGAITSKGITNIRSDTVTSLPLFWQLLPPICRTASHGYQYHFYFGYDADDVIANETMLLSIEDEFRSQVAQRCGGFDIGRLRLIRCDYSGSPAWAQNDAMMQAYLDGMDFFYRVNDDTVMRTKNWTDSYVTALREMAPPYVGVVGPTCAYGARGIMTHDFVHRTHIEIFGFYYPRAFPDWFADNWISQVYKPDRSRQLAEVIVKHSEVVGRRYRVRNKTVKMRRAVSHLTSNHSSLIERYVRSLEVPPTQTSTRSARGPCVVAMSLFGTEPRYMFGAVRNAQLMPIIYPGWTLRVYYHPRSEAHPEHNHLCVSDEVLETLVRLGAELFPVTEPLLLGEPRRWRYLVFDDVMHVDYALVRDADARVSMREARLVREWLEMSVSPSLHCVRDHPIQGIKPLQGGLWGAKVKDLRLFLGSNVTRLILELGHQALNNHSQSNTTSELRHEVPSNHCETDEFLLATWDAVGEHAHCDDSVTCELWDNSHPARRRDDERDDYVGHRYDAFGDGISLWDKYIYSESPECR